MTTEWSPRGTPSPKEPHQHGWVEAHRPFFTSLLGRKSALSTGDTIPAREIGVEVWSTTESQSSKVKHSTKLSH